MSGLSRRRRAVIAFWWFAMASLLSGCSKKEETPRIVNYTLPDVSSFNKAYASESKAQHSAAPADSDDEYRWIPHGVFTLNVVGDDGSWVAGFVNVSYVDLDTHTAIVSYSIKDNRGFTLAQSEGNTPDEKDYYLDSDGELVTGVDETEDEDGTRHIIIYLPDEHWLEFSGKERISSAQYHFNSIYYGMKREG